jgi:hypothetical protein
MTPNADYERIIAEAETTIRWLMSGHPDAKAQALAWLAAYGPTDSYWFCVAHSIRPTTGGPSDAEVRAAIKRAEDMERREVSPNDSSGAGDK